ncbi:MAG TPA: TauD/TfdA family dioxygenase [Gammaproteobacteria bacterium]
MAPKSGPFCLDDDAAYRRWREHKLCHYPDRLDAQRVSIAHPGRLKGPEREQILRACRAANFAVYQTDPGCPPTLAELRAYGEQLGLIHFDRHLWAPKDGIVALRRETEGARARYIPYTDRPMKWHTDGYYNGVEDAVRGVLMHCVQPAAEGGANWLLDPEMVYIAMRDEDPVYIDAFMQPDVMTIPENTLEPGAYRADVTGPVFSVDATGGTLHMRYTARTRSLRWRNDSATRDAVAFLEDLLAPPVSFAFRVSLNAGEGIVCNNVLHNREAFTDGSEPNQQRLLWRARYRERIANTIPCWGDGRQESL